MVAVCTRYVNYILNVHDQVCIKVPGTYNLLKMLGV